MVKLSDLIAAEINKASNQTNLREGILYVKEIELEKEVEEDMMPEKPRKEALVLGPVITKISVE